MHQAHAAEHTSITPADALNDTIQDSHVAAAAAAVHCTPTGLLWLASTYDGMNKSVAVLHIAKPLSTSPHCD
jgi:hypothetical protein